MNNIQKELLATNAVNDLERHCRVVNVKRKVPAGVTFPHGYFQPPIGWWDKGIVAQMPFGSPPTRNGAFVYNT